MIISREYNVIFVHIPRTAGTRISKSLCEAMNLQGWRAMIGEPASVLKRAADVDDDTIHDHEWLGEKHITAAQMRSRLGREVWDSCFKFAFVRNPWGRALSTYLHRRKVAPRLVKSVWPRSKWLFNAALVVKYDLLNRGSVQQNDFLTNDKNECLVDFIGRFERLEDDFRKVCDIIGLDAELGGKYDPTNVRDYRKWYTKQDRAIIRREKRTDVEQFNYTFE